jgi:hypothetical protein
MCGQVEIICLDHLTAWHTAIALPSSISPLLSKKGGLCGVISTPGPLYLVRTFWHEMIAPREMLEPHVNTHKPSLTVGEWQIESHPPHIFKMNLLGRNQCAQDSACCAWP